MRKDTYWFDHDYNARGDEKILEIRSAFGAEGYGVFWMIIETMAESSNGGINLKLIGGLSHGYGVAKDTLKNLIDLAVSVELFYVENGYVFSRRIKNHKDTRRMFSEKGKEGAKKRWPEGEKGEKNSPPIATLSPPDSTLVAITGQDITVHNSTVEDILRKSK